MNCVMLMLGERESAGVRAGPRTSRVEGDARDAAEQEVGDEAEASHQLGGTALFGPSGRVHNGGRVIVGGGGRSGYIRGGRGWRGWSFAQLGGHRGRAVAAVEDKSMRVVRYDTYEAPCCDKDAIIIDTKYASVRCGAILCRRMCIKVSRLKLPLMRSHLPPHPINVTDRDGLSTSQKLGPEAVLFRAS